MPPHKAEPVVRRATRNGGNHQAWERVCPSKIPRWAQRGREKGQRERFSRGEGIRFTARSPGSQPATVALRFPPLTSPPSSLSMLFPYLVFPSTIHWPLFPFSPAFTHTRNVEKESCTCVHETSLKRTDVLVCVPFSLGNAEEGCVLGWRGEGQGIRTRKEGETVSNGSHKREVERGRSSSTLLRVLRIFFGSDENAHSLAYVLLRISLSGSENAERGIVRWHRSSVARFR